MLKMNKKKKKNKQEGVILVKTVAVSVEEQKRIQDHLASLSCDFSFILKDPCEFVKFDETYYGPCPWCYTDIYTKDICPHCGGLIKFD